jgi:hypothetical protein
MVPSLLSLMSCALDATGRNAAVGTGGSLGSVGPGATVRVVTMDGAGVVAIVVAAAVILGALAWLLWKRDPNQRQTPPRPQLSAATFPGLESQGAK